MHVGTGVKVHTCKYQHLRGKGEGGIKNLRAVYAAARI